MFRLFTADGSRGSSEAAWWYLAADPATGGSMVVGPVDCEQVGGLKKFAVQSIQACDPDLRSLSLAQMIMAYSSGNLGDAHYTCGTTYNGNMAHTAGVPPQHLFERIGTLLFQVRYVQSKQAVSLLLFGHQNMLIPNSLNSRWSKEESTSFFQPLSALRPAVQARLQAEPAGILCPRCSTLPPAGGGDQGPAEGLLGAGDQAGVREVVFSWLAPCHGFFNLSSFLFCGTVDDS